MISKIINFVCTAILLSTLWTERLYAAKACSNIFSHSTFGYSITKKMGDTSKSIVAELDNNIFDVDLRNKLLASGKNNKFEFTIISLDQNYSYLQYREIPSSNAIIIDMIRVPEKFRGNGFSTRLIEIMLEQQPNLEKVVLELDMTNKTLFDSFPENSYEERLRMTPVFKSFSRLGFSQIIHVSEYEVKRNGIKKKFPHVILARDATQIPRHLFSDSKSLP